MKNLHYYHEAVCFIIGWTVTVNTMWSTYVTSILPIKGIHVTFLNIYFHIMPWMWWRQSTRFPKDFSNNPWTKEFKFTQLFDSGNKMCQAMPSFIVLLVAWCSLTLTTADVYCFFLLLLFSSSSCFGEVERKRGDDRILKKLLLLTPNRLSGQTKHSLSLTHPHIHAHTLTPTPTHSLY